MKKYFLILLSILVFFTPIYGCGEGTETGNPTAHHGDDDDDNDDNNDGETESPAGDASLTGAEQILDALCDKLTECNASLLEIDCETGILGTGGLENDLGLTEGSYDTYEGIIYAEENEEISADSTALTSCLLDIDGLSCDDAGVQSAYDEADADNFDNVENMVPNGADSCEGVF